MIESNPTRKFDFKTVYAAQEARVLESFEVAHLDIREESAGTLESLVTPILFKRRVAGGVRQLCFGTRTVFEIVESQKRYNDVGAAKGSNIGQRVVTCHARCYGHDVLSVEEDGSLNLSEERQLFSASVKYGQDAFARIKGLDSPFVMLGDLHSRGNEMSKEEDQAQIDAVVGYNDFIRRVFSGNGDPEHDEYIRQFVSLIPNAAPRDLNKAKGGPTKAEVQKIERQLEEVSVE